MSVSITNVQIDDGGEQVVFTLSGVTSPLAGTPVFLFHRSPGVDLNAKSFKIDSDTQITVNGVRLTGGGADSYIRAGEKVTVDYVSGLTGNSVAIPAINGVNCVNNSQREPRIGIGNLVEVNQDTPTFDNLRVSNAISVRAYKQSDIDAGAPVLIATAHIYPGGDWAGPMNLSTDVAYVFQFYNQENQLVTTKTLTL